MADEMGNLREERTGPNMVWELRGGVGGTARRFVWRDVSGGGRNALDGRGVCWLSLRRGVCT